MPIINVEAVEACGHEERREERIAAKHPVVMQDQFAIFVSLKRGKRDAQNNRNGQPVDQVFAVVFMNNRVVRPCHGTAQKAAGSTC